jgi:hypothetical protein
MVLTPSHSTRAAAGILLTVLLALAGGTGAALAGEMPSEWWLAKMNHDFVAQRLVRVRGPALRLELREATVDSIGVTGYPGREPTLLAQGGGHPASSVAPTTIAWDRIKDVELPHRATGFVALMGGAAGTMAAILASVVLGRDGDDPGADTRTVLMIATGAGLGAAAGSTQDRWEPYYPPPGTRKTAFEVRTREIKP